MHISRLNPGTFEIFPSYHLNDITSHTNHSKIDILLFEISVNKILIIKLSLKETFTAYFYGFFSLFIVEVISHTSAKYGDFYSNAQ